MWLVYCCDRKEKKDEKWKNATVNVEWEWNEEWTFPECAVGRNFIAVAMSVLFLVCCMWKLALCPFYTIPQYLPDPLKPYDLIYTTKWTLVGLSKWSPGFWNSKE